MKLMGKRDKITVSRRYTVAQGEEAAAEFEAAERILAKLIARAYAADHPELFPLHSQDSPGRALPPGRMSPPTTRGCAPGFLEIGEHNAPDSLDG